MGLKDDQAANRGPLHGPLAESPDGDIYDYSDHPDHPDNRSAARLDYQTGWRAWIVDRFLEVAVWAARSATRLNSHQEFGVWERRTR